MDLLIPWDILVVNETFINYYHYKDLPPIAMFKVTLVFFSGRNIEVYDDVVKKGLIRSTNHKGERNHFVLCVCELLCLTFHLSALCICAIYHVLETKVIWYLHFLKV